MASCSCWRPPNRDLDVRAGAAVSAAVPEAAQAHRGWSSVALVSQIPLNLSGFKGLPGSTQLSSSRIFTDFLMMFGNPLKSLTAASSSFFFLFLVQNLRMFTKLLKEKRKVKVFVMCSLLNLGLKPALRQEPQISSLS